PGFPKSSDFIALDCPQFGNRIGDSCPALPWVPQRIGDRIGDEFRIAIQSRNLPASFHASSILITLRGGVKPVWRACLSYGLAQASARRGNASAKVQVFTLARGLAPWASHRRRLRWKRFLVDY